MRILILACAFMLSGCSAGQPTEFGERLAEVAEVVETSVCPLTTARNIEGVLLNALHMVPLFNDWQPVCPEQ